MKSSKTKVNNRIGVIINYSSLILAVSLFEYYRYVEMWNYVSITAVSAALFVFIISFYLAYGRTGAWKQVHIPFAKLDEREAGIIYEALRISYSVFAIVALLIMLISAVLTMSVSIIIFAAMLLIAHILPASIIVWR